MRHTKHILFVLALGLVLSNCKKEIDHFIPVIEDVNFDFSKEFSDRSDTLSFNVDLSEPRIVKTPIGTQFVFKSEMFLNSDGSPCSCNEVEIRIIELIEKRDYLVHGAPTISGGQVLASAGAYHVSAYYDGKLLKLAPGEQVCFFLPSSDLDPEMEVFYGEKNNSVIEWSPARNQPGNASVTPGEWIYNDTTDLVVGYACFSDRLNWINVDKFISDGAKNPVCIKLAESYDANNTVAFAVLKKERSILNLIPESGEKFCISNIPKGFEVQFIAVSKRGENNYELAIETAKITDNHFQTLEFNPKSFDQIKSFLTSL